MSFNRITDESSRAYFQLGPKHENIPNQLYREERAEDYSGSVSYFPPRHRWRQIINDYNNNDNNMNNNNIYDNNDTNNDNNDNF